MTELLQKEREKYESVNLDDFGPEEAVILEQHSSASRAKLFYLSRDFVGSESSAKNKEALQKILQSILKYGNADNMKLSFLFVAEAANLLAKPELREAINSYRSENIEVYVDKAQKDKLELASDMSADAGGKMLDLAKVKLVDEAGMAELFLSYETITLC